MRDRPHIARTLMRPSSKKKATEGRQLWLSMASKGKSPHPTAELWGLPGVMPWLFTLITQPSRTATSTGTRASSGRRSNRRPSAVMWKVT